MVPKLSSNFGMTHEPAMCVGQEQNKKNGAEKLWLDFMNFSLLETKLEVTINKGQEYDDKNKDAKFPQQGTYLNHKQISFHW